MRKKLLITIIALLLCVIVVLLCMFVNMRGKYQFVKNYNDSIFLSNFSGLITSLAKTETNDTELKAEYYAESHLYAGIALSVAGASSYSERADLKKIIMIIDELCVFKRLYDPNGIPTKLIDKLMRLSHDLDNTELAKTVTDELMSISKERMKNRAPTGALFVYFCEKIVINLKL